MWPPPSDKSATDRAIIQEKKYLPLVVLFIILFNFIFFYFYESVVSIEGIYMAIDGYISVTNQMDLDGELPYCSSTASQPGAWMPYNASDYGHAAGDWLQYKPPEHVFQPFACKYHIFSSTQARQCLKKKVLFVAGDSLLRNIVKELIRMLEGPTFVTGAMTSNQYYVVGDQTNIDFYWTPSVYHAQASWFMKNGDEERIDAVLLNGAVWDMGTYYRGLSAYFEGWVQSLAAIMQKMGTPANGGNSPVYFFNLHSLHPDNEKCMLDMRCKYCNEKVQQALFREGGRRAAQCNKASLLDTHDMTLLPFAKQHSTDGVHYEPVVSLMEIQVWLNAVCEVVPDPTKLDAAASSSSAADGVREGGRRLQATREEFEALAEQRELSRSKKRLYDPPTPAATQSAVPFSRASFTPPAKNVKSSTFFSSTTTPPSGDGMEERIKAARQSVEKIRAANAGQLAAMRATEQDLRRKEGKERRKQEQQWQQQKPPPGTDHVAAVLDQLRLEKQIEERMQQAKLVGQHLLPLDSASSSYSPPSTTDPPQVASRNEEDPPLCPLPCFASVSQEARFRAIPLTNTETKPEMVDRQNFFASTTNYYYMPAGDCTEATFSLFLKNVLADYGEVIEKKALSEADSEKGMVAPECITFELEKRGLEAKKKANMYSSRREDYQQARGTSKGGDVFSPPTPKKEEKKNE